jgi:hypothetical protein
VNQCRDLFPLPFTKLLSYQSPFTQHLMLSFITVVCEHISTIDNKYNIYHQQSMTIKNTKCMYNFLFIMDYNPWVYQQQLNRVTTPQENQLYNARLSLHNSTPTEKRIQSSTDTNISIGMRPVSSETHICTFPTNSTTYVCTRPIYTAACILLLIN